MENYYRYAADEKKAEKKSAMLAKTRRQSYNLLNITNPATAATTTMPKTTTFAPLKWNKCEW
jgi:hypothetical protein